MVRSSDGLPNCHVNTATCRFHPNNFPRRLNSSIERVEGFKYLGTTLKMKIQFRKKLRAD